MAGPTRREVVKAVDASSRPFDLTVAQTLNGIDHAGRTLLLNAIAGFTTTLPPAIGSGQRYLFMVQAVLTSGTYVVQVASADDEMVGTMANIDTDTNDNMEGFQADAVAGADTFTMNATTQGGLYRGDWAEFQDLVNNFWYVRGQLSGSGNLTSNFTAAV